MKYVIIGFSIIIVVIATCIFNIFTTRNQILKMVVLGLNIIPIIMGALIIKVGFKIIKTEKRIALLRMWPESN